LDEPIDVATLSRICRRSCLWLSPVYKSMTTSPSGWAQQISTLPFAGASTGSGR